MTERKLKFSTALLADGWARDVVVEIDADGYVSAVIPGRAATDAEAIAGIAIPGVPNVHSHAHQRAMAGLAERSGPGADSFWTWREVMYGYALTMGPEELEAIAAQLYVENLKAGFTAIGEFQYLHHQPDGTPYDEPAEMSLRCVSAAGQAGLAITMLPTLYAFGGFGGQPSTEGQRRFINDAGRYLAILDTLFQVAAAEPARRQVGISPHSLRASTAELLSEVIAGLDSHDEAAPIHIHIAEQVKEVDDCVAWSGLRPVEYLLDHFPVSERWCAIHATHMTAEETERLARTGCIAGLCPTTEANLGDGIFNAGLWQRESGAIAIGSDSHITVSPAEDLRMLEYSQRLKLRARNVLAGGPDRSTGRTLFEAVLAGGAKCLNQPMGAIAEGKRADIVVLDADHPALAERQGDAVLDAWIFSGGDACVRDVFVAGDHLVEDGHHRDEARIFDTYRAAMRKLNA